MNLLKKSLCSRRVFYALLILLYVGINLAYLTRFPFVHSDESWLGGLSRNITDTGSFQDTEPFFDLKPRYPHAIKIIFHTLQIAVIKVFGYSITNLRLLSFVFGLLSLFYFFKLVKMESRSDKLALLCTALLAVDVQFIYASHFARQEIIVVFVLIFSMYYFFRHLDNHSTRHSILSGMITGLSIGIHPNSFIIFLPVLTLYSYYALFKRLKFRCLIQYVSVVAAFAAAFVMLSFYLDPNFITHYSTYGNEFDVFIPILSKFASVIYFYQKLFYMVSGTYYTPDIRLQFILFPLILVIALAFYFHNRKLLKDSRMIPIILSILAVNLGIILIGRYNQTSVIFQFPLFYLLLSNILGRVQYKFKLFFGGLLISLVLLNTINNVLPHAGNDYHGYLNEISKAVDKDDAVLANLNSEFYFDNGRLYDYRNLAYLKENNLSFDNYINQRGIKYVIYSEELDFIHDNEPRWDGIYGKLQYYNEMQDFLKYKCKLVHEFTNKTYGMRISAYINLKDWKISIYEVMDP